MLEVFTSMAFRGVFICVTCMLVAEMYAQKSQLMPDYMDHACVRPCDDEGEPMECRYRFVVESYQTLSRACYDCAKGNVTDCLRHHCVPANGFSRNIKTVNRGIPGPTIQVCEGDTIIVDMENYFAMAEGVAIHWHGILQHLSPHMDGVGMITQCPIQAGTPFQYKFLASDPGTHFWHAHTGLQRGEGMFGSLIVRQSPSREPHAGTYDFDLPEHVIIVNEWQNLPLLEIYTASHHSDGTQAADAVMINGWTQDTSETLELPRAVFQVEPGQRYRFRVINSGSLFCPIEISVDNHNLTLISSDGRAFEPFVVESFDMYSAERYDFILTTDQPVANYWLRARGLGACETNKLEEQAVVQYLSADPQEEEEEENSHYMKMPTSKRPDHHVTPFNSISVDDTVTLGDTRDQVIGMNALAPDDRSLTEDPDHQFLLDFSTALVDNLHFFDPDLYPAGQGSYSSIRSAQINRISNRLGPVPLLSQMDEIPQDMFCNGSSVGERCQTEWCECVHKVTVQQDDIVEMVLISAGNAGFTHPIHLHGYSYRVVAMDRISEGVISPELFREMDARGEIERKLSKAPFKDTVAIPNGGYIIMRFVADNPGVWFMHCHLAFHAEIGMSLAFEVLEKSGQLPAPPPNFPTCGRLPEDVSILTRRQREDSQSGTGNLHSLSSGGDERLLESSGVQQGTTPQWVAPVLIAMSVTMAALLLVVIQLWRRNRKMDSREQTTCFPTYQWRERNTTTREDLTGHENALYSCSKREEKMTLTH